MQPTSCIWLGDPIPNQFADVEGVVEKASFPCDLAANGRVSPRIPLGTGNPVFVEPRGDVASSWHRRPASRELVGLQTNLSECAIGDVESARRPTDSYFGCGTIRMYGFGTFQPAENFFLASSSM